MPSSRLRTDMPLPHTPHFAKATNRYFDSVPRAGCPQTCPFGGAQIKRPRLGQSIVCRLPECVIHDSQLGGGSPQPLALGPVLLSDLPPPVSLPAPVAAAERQKRFDEIPQCVRQQNGASPRSGVAVAIGRRGVATW